MRSSRSSTSWTWRTGLASERALEVRPPTLWFGGEAAATFDAGFRRCASAAIPFLRRYRSYNIRFLEERQRGDVETSAEFLQAGGRGRG